MERRYKPILPAAAATPPDRPENTGDKQEPPEQTVPKRRRIATACEECRSRKVAVRFPPLPPNQPPAALSDPRHACLVRWKPPLCFVRRPQGRVRLPEQP